MWTEEVFPPKPSGFAWLVDPFFRTTSQLLGHVMGSEGSRRVIQIVPMLLHDNEPPTGPEVGFASGRWAIRPLAVSGLPLLCRRSGGYHRFRTAEVSQSPVYPVRATFF